MIGVEGRNRRSHGKHGDKQELGELDIIQQEIRKALFNRLVNCQRLGGMLLVFFIEAMLLLAECQVFFQGLADRIRVRRRAEKVVRIWLVGLDTFPDLCIHIHGQRAGRLRGVRVQQVVVRPGLLPHPQHARVE